MKTKKYLIALLCGVFIFTGCSKDYLNTSPTDQVSEQSLFSTTDNARIALNGIHRILWRQYFSQSQSGQGSMMINVDNLGEDLINNSTSATTFFQRMYKWEAHRNVDDIDNYFAYFLYYRLISNANQIINSIDNAAGPDADKRAIKGEALVYRAWSHFNLVQLFAKRYDATAVPNTQMGVPLMTINTTEGLTRASVEEVYAQVNTDLDEAIANLTGYTRSYKSHFNVNVAKGIKARVALTMQNWTLAAQLANEARSGFSLMNNAQYLEGFSNAGNPEWMWASIIPVDQGTFFYSFFAYMAQNFSSNATRTNARSINSLLYAQISSTDVRKQLWDPAGVTPPLNGTRFPYTSSKFRVPDPDFSVGDVPYMRVAEMYLIEAEARARAGQDGPAATILYELAHNRDPSYTLSSNTGAALIAEIMIQRRIELWGEGFRFYDLKRTNSSLDRTGANHNVSIAVTMEVPAGDNKWQFLIPRDEIDANPQVQQNP